MICFSLVLFKINTTQAFTAPASSVTKRKLGLTSSHTLSPVNSEPYAGFSLRNNFNALLMDYFK